MKRPQPQRLDDYIRHILTALDNILAYTAGMDWGAFEADRKTQDAVVRNLEVIGEACNNIVKHHGGLRDCVANRPVRFARAQAQGCQLALIRRQRTARVPQTMLKVMAMPQYSHPAYWAPYALVGDGGR